MIANSRSTSWWLSAAVGSSNTRTRALRSVRTFAISTSWRSASESEPTTRSGRMPPTPIRSSASSAVLLTVSSSITSTAGRLRAERQVVGDREVGQEAQLLVDDADAKVVRVGRSADLDRLAPELDRAGRRRVIAGEVFRSVDLPAPFSPRSPWIVPASTSRSTSSSASVPGNRFVMPRMRSSGTRSCADVTP